MSEVLGAALDLVLVAERPREKMLEEAALQTGLCFMMARCCAMGTAKAEAARIAMCSSRVAQLLAGPE